jgi:hypothetical protein
MSVSEGSIQMTHTPMFPSSAVHLSPTPLVGAPGKVAAALDRQGVPATSIVLTDYPKDLAGKFIAGSILWEQRADVVGLIDRLIRDAAIIHVHNDLPVEVADRVLKLNPNAIYIYQVHSPLREGPLYLPRAAEIGLPFSARLVVGQYHPRLYPDHIPVPNLVDAPPSCCIIRPGERLRVVFSPSHNRDGRWNGKTCPELDDALRHLAGLGLVEPLVPSAPLSPRSLMELRRTAHVSIDEIVTGAFHQVSLEGLCAGNVVINGADFFSRAMLAECAGTNQFPPFVTAGPDSIGKTLLNLALNPERVAQIQRASALYFQNFLMPDRLVQGYINLYRSLLDENSLQAA